MTSLTEAISPRAKSARAQVKKVVRGTLPLSLVLTNGTQTISVSISVQQCYDNGVRRCSAL